MKVIKVIVDELPKGCKDCDLYGTLLNGNYFCRAVRNGDKGFMEFEHLTRRPDWCPLITGEELLWLVQSPFRQVDDYTWESEE